MFGTSVSAVGELVGIINRLIDYGLGILVVISVAFIVYAAYLYLTAIPSGDEEDITKARRIIVYTCLAIVIGLLSKGIVYVVGKIVAPSVDLGL